MSKNPEILPLVTIYLALSMFSCNNSSVPKPRGHFRIDLPSKEYIRFDSICPFTFEYPVYSLIKQEPGMDEYCWFNIEFPDYKGKLHLSYMDVSNNLKLLTDDAHKLAYKHSVKADAIEEKLWINDEVAAGLTRAMINQMPTPLIPPNTMVSSRKNQVCFLT